MVGSGLALSGFDLASAAATTARFAWAGMSAGQGIVRGTSRLVQAMRG